MLTGVKVSLPKLISLQCSTHAHNFATCHIERKLSRIFERSVNLFFTGQIIVARVTGRMNVSDTVASSKLIHFSMTDAIAYGNACHHIP